jgi:hypothetical protein
VRASGQVNSSKKVRRQEQAEKGTRRQVEHQIPAQRGFDSLIRLTTTSSTLFDEADAFDALFNPDASLALEYPDGSLKLHEKIRQRAYELYEKRGGKHGQDLADWLKAETELRS